MRGAVPVALALGALAGGALVAPWGVPGHAQTGNFQPGANPISNQAWSATLLTGSTTNIQVTRALFIGAASACNITVTPNGTSTALTLTNVQPGEILPIQIINFSASSTCTSVVALY
jgi:hypothetical protein